MAEHELLDDPVVGVAFDGTGYGNDGGFGAASFSSAACVGLQREASLRPVQMPGGDAAARFPVQAAAGFLAELDDLPDMTAEPFWLSGAVPSSAATGRAATCAASRRRRLAGCSTPSRRSSGSRANRPSRGRPRCGSNIKLGHPCLRPPIPVTD